MMMMIVFNIYLFYLVSYNDQVFLFHKMMMQQLMQG